MYKNSLRTALRKIKNDKLKKVKPIPVIPEHLKKYKNMTFQRNNIINVEYRMRTKPNFEDLSKLPIKLNLAKYRIPTRLKEEK